MSLDRYTVIEEAETWEIYNWLQYYSPDVILTKLKRAGFSTVEIIQGFGIDAADPNTSGVIAGL